MGCVSLVAHIGEGIDSDQKARGERRDLFSVASHCDVMERKENSDCCDFDVCFE